MSWIGFLQFPEPIRYLIENSVPKLTEVSSSEDWMTCLAALRKYKHYIWNEDVKKDSKLFPSKRWTMVHHAAHFKAPLSILQMLSVDRYPLSLPDAEGRLAIDHLCNGTPKDVKDLLKPSFRMKFLHLELKLIQANFHAVILERIEALVSKYNLILPIISVMLEDIAKTGEIYFNVPGMYGGFTYWFEYSKDRTEVVALWCKSSSRLVGNSEQLHKCTSEGWSLIQRGQSTSG